MKRQVKMAYLIAISGGSGSGKTYISRALNALLPFESSILSYDNYYKDQSHLKKEERALLNYDDPSILDQELFMDDLAKIKKGLSIEVPQYDFASHTRKIDTLKFTPTDVVLVEGIMTLQIPKQYYDFIVYVDADPDVRIARRIIRDTKLRGRTPESVVSQYLASVKPMHIKYVEPHKVDADFVFDNNSNDGIDEKQMQALIRLISSRR